MGAADDIKKGLTKNLANFTKQRKAEEKHAGALRWRMSRMREVRGTYIAEAANAVMKECYAKASDNGTLPATSRQIYYVARQPVEERTDKPLSYPYFSQTLLPDYVKEHRVGWDVVYDDRGHFIEPHTRRVIGLGTLGVRSYLGKNHPLRLDECSFDPASIETYGPNGSFGAVLYVEKEGFMPLFERVQLAERYDIAIMSSKGMSVTAARELVDQLCRHGVPLLVLHDFNSAGIIIADTLQTNTRRYSYKSAPNVIDLGLLYADIDGLPSEPNNSNISGERLREAGLDEDAINFLRSQRVELNALRSRQLVDFVERKLKQHGIGKVIPDTTTLKNAYRMFAASDHLSKAFDDLKDKPEYRYAERRTKVPDDLEAKVKAKLQENPSMTWHRAVNLLVDPDAVGDDDIDDIDDIDDEDLSDIE